MYFEENPFSRKKMQYLHMRKQNVRELTKFPIFRDLAILQSKSPTFPGQGFYFIPFFLSPRPHFLRCESRALADPGSSRQGVSPWRRWEWVTLILAVISVHRPAFTCQVLGGGGGVTGGRGD